MSWKEADVAAREIAGGLLSLGVGHGDAIACVAQTRIEWTLCDIGVLHSAALMVPIYASSSPAQCAFIVKDAEARVAVVENAAQLEKLVPLGSAVPGLRLIYIDGDARFDKPDGQGRTEVKLAEVLAAARDLQHAPLSLEALREAGRDWLAKNPDAIAERSATLGPDDIFTNIYTSGTTGNPKGVILSHGNMVAAITSATRALALYESDEQLLFLPLAHVLGRELQWATVYAGSCTAFCEGMTKIKDNLVTIRPTFMAGVPRVFEKFFSAVQAGSKQGSPIKKALVAWAFGVGQQVAAAQRRNPAVAYGGGVKYALANKLVLSKLRAKLGLDRCRFLISGGAPLAAEIAEFFHGVGLLVLEGYGLTETLGAAFLNRIEKYRFGTVGPALDVVKAEIAPDGEILIGGPSVFKRYHNRPEATAEAIDAAGWFHSGDIGVIEDGFLRITDRKKDLIVTSAGKNIAPQILENALKMRCPLLSQVMVYGDKRPYCVAVVTLSEEANKRFGAGDPAKAASAPEAKAAVQKDVDALNATLANFETIKTIAILPSDFSEETGELTPSLKIKRKVVVDRYRPVIDQLYA
jgi:long-chain acyl-CoA synthetase